MKDKTRFISLTLASTLLTINSALLQILTLTTANATIHQNQNFSLPQTQKTAVCLPLVGCVKTPLPNVLEKPVENAIQKEALRSLFRDIINDEVPIVVSTDNKYPTTNNLPDGEFNPNLLDLTDSIAKNDVIEPGDYIIPVKVYCLKQRASSPDGKRYLLSQFKGKYKQVIKDLNRAASLSNISHRQLQTISWNIQGGVPYSQMSADSKQIIDQLIPQHKQKLEGSWWEKIEREWGKAARNYHIPSFENLMAELGDIGKVVLQIKQFREYLIQNGSNYQALSDAFIIGNRNEYAPSENDVLQTPWSRVRDNVYARFVTHGNYDDTGLLLVRILPETTAQNKFLSPAVVLRGGLLALDLIDLITTISAIAEGKQDVQPLAMSYDPTVVTDAIEVGHICRASRNSIGRLMCRITKGGKISVKKPSKNSNIAKKDPNNSDHNPNSRKPKKRTSEQRQEELNKLADEIGVNFKDHPLRKQYEDKVRNLAKKAEQLKREMGTSPESLEKIAKQMWRERRDLGEKYKDMTPEALRDYIYEVNMQRYRDPLGITWDDMLKKYSGNYEKIIASSAEPNKDINKLLSGFREWLIKNGDKYLP